MHPLHPCCCHCTLTAFLRVSFTRHCFPQRTPTTRTTGTPTNPTNPTNHTTPTNPTPQIGAALAPHLHVLPPRQLVPALTYFAALGSLPPSVDPAKLGTRVGAALPQLRVPGLVVLCWVVLRLRAPPQGLDTAALCAALAPTVPRMGSTEVATVAEALAMLSTLSKLPEPSNDAGVRQAVVHAANRVLPSAATPGEVVRTLRALRALRLAGQVRPSVVATAVSRAARAAGSAQELSRLLAMAARVPGVATRLDGGAVGAALQAHAGGADGHALARLLWCVVCVADVDTIVD